MSSEVIGIIGLVLSAAMAIVAVVYWRKSQHLQTILAEAANRFEAGRKHNQFIEGELKSTAERLQQSRDALTKLERQFEDARGRLAGHTRQLEAQKSGQRDELDRLLSKVDNLEQQVTALTAQLVEANSAKRLANSQIEEMTKDLAARREAKESSRRETQSNQILNDEIHKLQEKVNEAERARRASAHDVEKLREVLRKFDPMELKKAKQRLAKMEQLYTSMKGLREMAEERTENWQVALKALSTHILGAEAKDYDLAPMVGAALEKIGASLVDDEHVPHGRMDEADGLHTSERPHVAVGSDEHHT